MSNEILSFNAGYANYDPETKTVTCKPGSGKITLTNDSEEPFVYFQWSPRDAFQPPVDFIETDSYVLIPGDAYVEHVTACTTGRVFVLKFRSSDKKEFFWLQDKVPKVGELSEKDKSILETFEKLLDVDEDEEEEEDDDSEAPVPGSTVIQS